jgi:hypothetical protein
MLKTIAMILAGALLSFAGAAAASETQSSAGLAQRQSGRIELAQYYEPQPPRDYYRHRPPAYDPDPYYRPRPRYYQEPLPQRPRVRMTDVCITSRGACPVYPQPPGRPCRCEIPGFGVKRGATGY